MICWTVLGMALVHFVWQGALIALLLFAAMRCTGQARLRHGIAVTSMVLMIAGFAVTLASSVPAAKLARSQGC